MRLERIAQLAGIAKPASGQREFAARLRQRRKGIQGGVQEPAQPDALAAAVFADAVHAVVPVAGAHQRQAMHAEIGAFESAAAMLEQGRGFVADARFEECIMTLARQRRSFDEG
jgi:hypothetical protein